MMILYVLSKKTFGVIPMNKVLLIVLVFVTLSIDVFLLDSIPKEAFMDPKTVIASPWWIFWSNDILASDITAIFYVIHSTSTELGILIMILCFGWGAFGAHVRNLAIIGFTITQGRGLVTRGPFILGMSISSGIMLLFAGLPLTGIVFAICKYAFIALFLRVLFRVRIEQIQKRT
jgi:hypothetical protein